MNNLRFLRKAEDVYITGYVNENSTTGNRILTVAGLAAELPSGAVGFKIQRMEFNVHSSDEQGSEAAGEDINIFSRAANIQFQNSTGPDGIYKFPADHTFGNMVPIEVADLMPEVEVLSGGSTSAAVYYRIKLKVIYG